MFCSSFTINCYDVLVLHQNSPLMAAVVVGNCYFHKSDFFFFTIKSTHSDLKMFILKLYPI